MYLTSTHPTSLQDRRREVGCGSLTAIGMLGMMRSTSEEEVVEEEEEESLVGFEGEEEGDDEYGTWTLDMEEVIDEQTENNSENFTGRRRGKP